MAVLAEMYSVILRNATVEAQYPAGLEGYRSACPNSSFCSDGEICRIGFMAWADAESFLRSLEAVGLLGKDPGPAALVKEGQGLLHPCDWIELGRLEAIPAAALIGSQLGVLVAPPGWSPGAGKNSIVTEADLQRDFELVVTRGGVETYRNRASGELVHLGRTQPPQASTTQESRSMPDSRRRSEHGAERTLPDRLRSFLRWRKENE